MDDRKGALQEDEKKILLAIILILVKHDMSEPFPKSQILVSSGSTSHRYFMTVFCGLD
jgi:hypothetical protein